MKTFFLFFLLLFLPFAAPALTLKDKLLGAKEGDFIVTEQNKIYSLLIVREVLPSFIELEEISVPESHINLKETSWSSWLAQGSPGHSSWMLYQIDFVEEKLQESYSFSQKQWLYVDDSDYLFAKLLTLSLTAVSDKEKRRIGPPPQDVEPDRRAIWDPPLTREGKKMKKPHYDVYRGQWPKDQSQLSACTILFYFDQERPSFPFPYWLELSNGYISLKLRAIDSGSGLHTPLAHTAPPPPFHFTGASQPIKEGLRLSLFTLPPAHNFQLFARNLTDPNSPPCAVEFQVKSAKQTGTVYLDIAKKDLTARLMSGHQYVWVLRSKSRPQQVIESPFSFHWKP